MTKKYKLLKHDTVKVNGHKLYRIKALKNFGVVKKGELGGYIEKEDNLSHEGNCWVDDKAWVHNNAKVYDNAFIHGYAKIFCNAEIFGDAEIYDNVWVYENAKVFGDAEVYNNTCIYGHAKVFGNARICKKSDIHENAEVFGNVLINDSFDITDNACINSQNGYLLIKGIGLVDDDKLVFYKCADDSLMVHCKIYNGTLEEFEKLFDSKEETQCIKEYKTAIDLAKLVFKI